MTIYIQNSHAGQKLSTSITHGKVLIYFYEPEWKYATRELQIQNQRRALRAVSPLWYGELIPSRNHFTISAKRTDRIAVSASEWVVEIQNGEGSCYISHCLQTLAVLSELHLPPTNNPSATHSSVVRCQCVWDVVVVGAVVEEPE